jgi:hypothetical protein
MATTDTGLEIRDQRRTAQVTFKTLHRDRKITFLHLNAAGFLPIQTADPAEVDPIQRRGQPDPAEVDPTRLNINLQLLICIPLS